ncbi:Beta-lactamase superfamily domain protein [uncultured archaeon]|nr:Beta-lactamase superfamily domain protein [uncultured archaeon]
MNLTYLGHAGFRLQSKEGVIYFDPYQIKKPINDGDIVLVSHSHRDHCDPESILAVSKKDAVVIAAQNAAAKASAQHSVSEGNALSVGGFKITAVPAYNTNKPFHPRGFGVGFIVEAEGKRIYHAGDTDAINEMMEYGPVDVALLPVSGTYVMTAPEAAEAAKLVKAKLAIPMHYGEVIGSKDDAVFFKKLLERLNGKVVILNVGESLDA